MLTIADSAGSLPSAGGSVRLFVAPGVGHCRGGRGRPLRPADGARDLVERHAASLASDRARRDVVASLCPYPQLPRYKGGDPTRRQFHVFTTMTEGRQPR
jgi:hypothetical protein